VAQRFFLAGPNVRLVNARPAKDHKKGADMGIDGYIKFFDDKSGQAKQVIVQVKSPSADGWASDL